MATNSKQGLEPLVCNEPKILILGSLPGDISIESQEYYANHKNFFWRIIATITGSPVPLSYPAKKGDACAKSYCPLGCLCRSRTYWQQRREYPWRRVQWHSRIYQKEPDNINNCVQREKGSQVLRAILEKASRHDKHSRTSAHLRMPKHKPGNPLHGTDFWWLGEQMEGYFDLTQTFLVWTEDLPKGESPQKRNRVFHRLRPRRRVVAAMDCDFQTGVLSNFVTFSVHIYYT